MVGLTGIGKSVCGLLLMLGTGGGCGRTFGSDYAPGPAILPPSDLAAKSVEGCGAGDLAAVQGKHFTTLAEVQLKGQLRVLRPGQGLTRDLMPDRLNVQIDGNGIVLRMFCG